MNFATIIGINSTFLAEDFYTTLRTFNDSYWEWLLQMRDNERGFNPYTMEESSDSVLNSVRGIQLKNGGFLQGTSNYERFTVKLNKTARQVNNASNIENRFVENFYLATEKLVKEK